MHQPRRVLFAICFALAAVGAALLVPAAIFSSASHEEMGIGLAYLLGLIFAASPALERRGLRWVAPPGSSCR